MSSSPSKTIPSLTGCTTDSPPFQQDDSPKSHMSVTMGSSTDFPVEFLSGSSISPRFGEDNSPIRRMPSFIGGETSRGPKSLPAWSLEAFIAEREGFLSDNAVLRAKLRAMKGKIPVGKGERMYDDNNINGDLLPCTYSYNRLQAENDRMRMRLKRHEWFEQNKPFAGTPDELDDVLFDLDLLSSYELSDGDEPDDPSSST